MVHKVHSVMLAILLAFVFGFTGCASRSSVAYTSGVPEKNTNEKPMFTIVNNTGKAWDNVFIAALQRIIQDDPVEYDLDWNSEAEITGFLNGNPISITGLYLNGAFIAISLYSEDMVILNGDSIILPVPSFKSSYGIVCHGDDNMYQKFPVSITPNASFVFTPDDITENPVID